MVFCVGRFELVPEQFDVYFMVVIKYKFAFVHKTDCVDVYVQGMLEPSIPMVKITVIVHSSDLFACAHAHVCAIMHTPRKHSGRTTGA